MRKRFNLKKRLAVGLLAGLMVFTFNPGLKAQAAYTPQILRDQDSDDRNKIAEIEKEKEAIEAKKNEARAKLADLNEKKADVLEVIQELDNQIAEYKIKIADLTDQKNAIQAGVAATENKLQNAYIAESNQFTAMKERIQYAYETGDVAYIDALMSVKSYDDIINQAEYVEQVSAYDQREIQKLVDIEKDIEEYEAQLKDQLAEVKQLRLEAEGEKEALEIMQDEKKEKVAEYQVMINDTENDISQYEAEQQSMDAQIAAIEAEAERRRQAAIEAARRAAEEEARRQAAQQASVQSSQSSAAQLDASTAALANAPTYSGGALYWPMPGGTVLSGFGQRSLGYHRGIDIPCPEGSAVYAAAGGVVIHVGWYGTGGNAVIVDCGGGMTNMYYHLSGYAVSTGQIISAGQVIAYSGNTGYSTGPHLHFGVRINGSYVDPMGYF